ncbi:pseudouridine synthase [Enterococcus timonensis]|uniref:pseudouridine synthase n=1 Tax=Enterococcus timonensis TaxID=1852364 RepID=UPI0008DA9C8C|nr:pseudouridine synthase [Enterococcus timonensis]
MQLAAFLQQIGKTKKEVKHLLVAHLVTIDGVITTSGTATIDPGRQKITVRRQHFVGVAHRYILFNKPVGVISANSDQSEPTIFSLLPADFSNLRFVGRLDKSAHGLMLLTDNGQLNYQIHQDRFHVSKKYLVETKEALEKNDVELFAAGLVIDESTRLAPAKLILLDQHHGLLEITEGKFHQVKKMFLSVGKKVVDLERIAIGPLDLPAKLAPGEFREINDAEFELLKKFFKS